MQRCVGWSQSTLAVLQRVHTFVLSRCIFRQKSNMRSTSEHFLLCDIAQPVVLYTLQLPLRLCVTNAPSSPVQRTPLYLPPTYASEEARSDEIGHHPQNLTNKHDKHKHDMMLQYVDEKLPTWTKYLKPKTNICSLHPCIIICTLSRQMSFHKQASTRPATLPITNNSPKLA